MIKLNAVDLSSIQECLFAYHKLIKWLPTIDDTEKALKQDRLEIVEFLINKCERIIRQEARENE